MVVDALLALRGALLFLAMLTTHTIVTLAVALGGTQRLCVGLCRVLLEQTEEAVSAGIGVLFNTLLAFWRALVLAVLLAAAVVAFSVTLIGGRSRFLHDVRQVLVVAIHGVDDARNTVRAFLDVLLNARFAFLGPFVAFTEISAEAVVALWIALVSLIQVERSFCGRGLSRAVDENQRQHQDTNNHVLNNCHFSVRIGILLKRDEHRLLCLHNKDK